MIVHVVFPFGQCAQRYGPGLNPDKRSRSFPRMEPKFVSRIAQLVHRTRQSTVDFILYVLDGVLSRLYIGVQLLDVYVLGCHEHRLEN